MLCVTLRSYSRGCGAVTGGVSDIFFFDPSDFTFTQVGATDPYTVVARRAGATPEGGALMFPVTFNVGEANRTWAHSRKGCSVKYDHVVNAQLPQLSNALTNFLSSLDAAGCCCGLGMIIRHNDQKVFVAGEKYVNAEEITKFIATMDGSSGDSGKLFDDPNIANVVIKAPYSRDLREFTGAWSALQAFTDGIAALSITTQPLSNAYAAGGTLDLTVVPAGGTTPYTYQWKKGGVNVSGGTGGTTAHYIKTGLITGDAGTYTCVITDAASGTITSTGAVITVV